MTSRYHSLLPQNDLKLENYQEALNYAIDTDEIRNIALSGSYGSGKSSVINSYEQMHKDKKFLHITLADFKEQPKSALSSKVCAVDEPKTSVEKNSSGAEKADINIESIAHTQPGADVKSTVDLLEGKILNQLLHQIDLKNVPLSRFRSKNTNPPKMCKRHAFFCVVFILLLLYTICFDAWQTMVAALPPGPLDISWSAHPSLRVVVLFICIVMGGVAVYYLLRAPGLRRFFKKVNIKDVVDVEVFETEDDAVFDRYLDEVLYLFEQSGADVIVFEDLDRYDVTQIFGKLKEISDLLYQRKKIRDSQFLEKQKNRKQSAAQGDDGNVQRGSGQGKERRKQQDKSLGKTHPKVFSGKPGGNTVSSPVPKFFYLIRDDVFSSSELIDIADDKFWTPKDIGYDLTTNRCFPLLKYLISQGYIDEHYTFYISYFRPNSLTARDMNFRIALNTHQALGYDYALDNPAAVLEWIDDSYFSRDELSNFTLFNYLIEQGCITELHLWLDSIELRHELNPSSLDFPIALWRQSPHHTTLAQLINEKMPHWFQLWTLLGLIAGGEWHRYAIDTLLHSSGHTLEKMNAENWLADAISIRKDFMQVDAPQIEKLIEKFKYIGVKFLFIDFREQDAEFVRRVYEENLYRLEDRTLTLWLTLYYDAPADSALNRVYTYLANKPNEPLSCWVQENTGAFMEALLNIENLRFLDDPEAVVALLNHSSIELNYKKEYISRLDTHLDMLKDIEQQELWPDLLRAGLVSFAWENVADYYEVHCADDNEIDETLCGFLEKGGSELLWSPSKLKERIGEENTDKLQDNLLECTELSLNRYRAIWATMGIHYTGLSTTTLPDEYTSILIELGIIAMTTNNVTYIRKSYPDFMTDFLLKDGGTKIAELVTKGEVSLTESEMAALLKDPRIKESNALSLLSAYSGTLSIADTIYPESIKAAIIDNHFLTSDIEWVLAHFTEQSETIQSAFIRQAKADFSLVSSAAIDSELIPIPVYAMCLDIMDLDQAEKLRRFLPDPNFEAVCTSAERQKFPCTEDIRLILGYFKQNGWIDSYRKHREHYLVTPKQREAVEV